MVKYSQKDLSRTFAALADPTRRRILAHLARGSRRVTHLAQPHNMSLPAVSKHLRVLEKAGLLRRRRHGRVHEMELEAKPLQQAAQWVEEYRELWEGSFDRLAAYLEKEGKKLSRRNMVPHLPEAAKRVPPSDTTSRIFKTKQETKSKTKQQKKRGEND